MKSHNLPHEKMTDAQIGLLKGGEHFCSYALVKMQTRSYNPGGKSPQNGTERVSVTSAKTFFSLKDWAKMKSESSIIYVTMEKKHSGQAPTLGL